VVEPLEIQIELKYSFDGLVDCVFVVLYVGHDFEMKMVEMAAACSLQLCHRAHVRDGVVTK